MAARRWLQWLKKALAYGSKASPGGRGYRPALESLEDRRVLNSGPWGGHAGLGHLAHHLSAEEPGMQVISSENTGDPPAHRFDASEESLQQGSGHHACGGNSEESSSAEDSTTATNVNQTQT